MNKTINISFLNLALFAIIIAGLIFFVRGCSNPVPALAIQPKVTEVRTTDTVLKIVQGQSEQIRPIIITTTPASPVVIPPQYQNLPSDTGLIRAMSNEIISQHYAVNHYSNKISLKDSSGKEVGEVNLKQDVTKNELQPFSPTYTLRLPVVTNTIERTVTQPEIKRNQWFLGGGLIGDQESLVRAIKAGVIVKSKQDWALELNATTNGKVIGGDVGFYKLISFRKK